MMPLGARSNTIGIDLGTHSVKVASVRPQHGTFEVTAAEAGVELAGDPPREVWLDVVEGAVRIAAARAGCRLAGQHAVFLLPVGWTEVRSLEPENLRADAAVADVAAYVEQELGTELAGCVWDYWFTSGTEGSDTLHLVLTRKSRAEMVAELARRLGCDAIALDTVPWTHYRLFRLAMPRTRTGIVLDWGLGHAWLTVIGAESPLYCRRLPRVSFEPVLKELSEALGLDRATLLATLQQGGPQDAPTAELWRQLLEDASDGAIRRFADEVQRTLEFTQARFGQDYTQTILAAGGVLTLEPLRRRVAELLSRPLALPQREEWTRWPQFAVFAASAALAAIKLQDATLQ